MTWGVRGLTVRLGPRVALDDVTLEVPDRAVTAVVGGDGAGKTTLLRSLVGTVQPSAGEVSRPPPDQVGYVSAGPGVYLDLSVAENLGFAASAYGIVGDEVRERIGDLLVRTGLTDARDRLAGRLSGGMRQKLAFAMGVLHRPGLLVLDEPTTGLDPVSRAELWQHLADAAAGGAAVLLATNYMDEAERATGVLVLDRGRALVSGSPEDILAAIPGTVVETAARPEGVTAWRAGEAWRSLLPGSAGGGGPRATDAIPVPRDRLGLRDAVIVAALRTGSGDGEAAT
jgi:ABC-2 type transport system ATP-binding protein